MSDPTELELKNVRATVVMTPTEKAALEFLQKMHPDRYEGYTNVLRDYSLSAAVQAFEAAKAELGVAAA